jgi:hypothetical protein
MTGNSSLDIPTCWTESDSSGFEYEHDIGDVTVYLQSESEGSETQVDEGEEFPRPDDSATVWTVKIDTNSRYFSYEQNLEEKSDAEDLAAEFMQCFEDEYEGTNGDVHEAISNYRKS